jgi:hypothetical protein
MRPAVDATHYLFEQVDPGAPHRRARATPTDIASRSNGRDGRVAQRRTSSCS